MAKKIKDFKKIKDIGKLKIKKKMFSFEVRERYNYEEKYKTIEKPPIEKLRDFLDGFKKKEKPEKIEKMKKRIKKEKFVLPFGFDKKMVSMAKWAIPLALLLAVGIWLFLGTFTPSSLATDGQIVSVSRISGSIFDSNIISASMEMDSSAKNIAQAVFRLDTEAVEGLNVKIDAYSGTVPSSVYFFKSTTYQSTSYPAFKRYLINMLEKKDIPYGEIDYTELKSLPRGSLLVVPSGYLPAPLFGEEDGVFFDELLSRGVTIIYLGQPLNKMITSRDEIKNSPAVVLTKQGIKTTSAGLPSGINLRNPLYVLSGMDSDQVLYGCVSALSYGEGYLVTLPQTLDVGWENPLEAADDVMLLIEELPWLNKVSSRSIDVAYLGDGEFWFFSAPFTGNEIYLRIRGVEPTNTTGFTKVVHVEKKQKGELLYVTGDPFKVLPFEIGGLAIDFAAHLKETVREVKDLFLIVRGSEGLMERTAIGSRVDVTSKQAFYHQFSIPGGEYVLDVVDGEGKIYASAYMRVVGLFIESVGTPDFENNKFTFQTLVAGEALPVRSIIVTIDDGKYGIHTFNDVSLIQLDIKEDYPEPLPVGEHKFSFQVGKAVFDLTLEKPRRQTLLDDPVIILTIFLAIVIVGAGIVFARQSQPVYSIDIPDFPPHEVKKIVIKKQQILDVFPRINERYKWNEMPLTLSEIKSGFKDTMHHGMSIFISDYNLQYILQKLVEKGDIIKVLDYYSVSSLGENQQLKAMFRKIRDICINYAVPFSPLGKSKDLDTKIRFIGQDFYIHLYDGNLQRIIPNILSSAVKGVNIILVNGKNEKREVYGKLISDSSLAGLIKFELQTGSVSIKTAKELEDMIKEMKG
ncbi:hypothetical protein KAW38_03550 [Candidatus Micrarchaeota archaeon]|nr:hypothetical protein [Candidatus Micrarchaeota archaeon]